MQQKKPTVKRNTDGGRTGTRTYIIGSLYISAGLLCMQFSISFLPYLVQITEGDKYYWELGTIAGLIIITGFLIIFSEAIHKISKRKSNFADLLHSDYWKTTIRKFPLVFLSYLTILAALILLIIFILSI
jgi:hypothetical protein